MCSPFSPNNVVFNCLLVNPFLFAAKRLMMQKYEDIYHPDKAKHIKRRILGYKSNSTTQLRNYKRINFFNKLQHERNYFENEHMVISKKIAGQTSRGGYYGTLSGKKWLLFSVERAHVSKK